MATQRAYLIIGGSGFLGKYIVDELLNRGENHVKIFDINKPRYTLDPRIEFIQGDITKLEDVKRGCKGVYTVINTASPTHDRGYDFFFRVNVLGTENVIAACQSEGVKQLIYTSTASVVFYGQDIKAGNETLPYPQHHPEPYNYTKQLAEEKVMAANGKSGVMTCSIRPSGIFGPGDVQAWPGFLSVAKEKILGKSKSILQIGDGTNLFDWTYVENVAHAHVLASDKLTTGSPIGGQAYFITNGEPTPFWDMPKYIYKQFGYPQPSVFLPYKVMLLFAQLVAFFVWMLSPIVTLHPTFTPLRITNAGAHRYFSIEKAKRDFGYKPIVSLDEAKERTLKHFKQMRAEGKI